MAFQAPKGVSEYVPPRSALFEAWAAYVDSPCRDRSAGFGMLARHRA